MIDNVRIRLIALIVVCACCYPGIRLKAQYIPVGEPYFEQNLLTHIWSDSSNKNLKNYNRPFRISNNPNIKITSDYGKSLFNSNDRTILKILPMHWNFEANSHYPFEWNNGSMKRIRGYQQQLSAGIYARWRSLEIQVQPEIIHVSSQPYEIHHDDEDQLFWSHFNRLSERSSHALYLEDSSYVQIFPGQSEVSVTFFGQRAGLAYKNLWWGPGQNHSLTMTNNSSGFYHIFLENSSPINIAFANLSYQILGAKLTNITYNNKTPFLTNKGLHQNKTQDWRYFSAINISLSPKLSPGLSFGFIRTNQQYSKTAFENGEYLPFGFGITRTATGAKVGDERDQQASIYFDWALTSAGIRIYAELGRNDSPNDIRDASMSLLHSAGIVAGFQKSMSVLSHQWVLSYEYIRLERSGSYLFRPEPHWYLNRRVSHGFTQNGEFIGSGLPWGSNAHHWKFDWLNQNNTFGTSFDFIRNYNDFFNLYNQANNSEQLLPWIDIVPGIYLEGRYGNLFFNFQSKLVFSQNYFWNQNNILNDQYSQLEYNKNLFIRLKLSYQI
jgi:hypothetical protein